MPQYADSGQLELLRQYFGVAPAFEWRTGLVVSDRDRALLTP